MIVDSSKNSICPNCQQRAGLACVTPGIGGLPELHTFRCRPCGEVFTEAVGGPAARSNIAVGASWQLTAING